MGLTNRMLHQLMVATLALFSIHPAVTVHCSDVQWQIITKSNFTSQIRLHSHLLLLVTVPWSGESRTLMKEIAHVVTGDQARFGTLKLMVLHKNVERVLADALGATHGTTIFFYHNTFSYKYWGKIRVQNILSSVQYVLSFSPDELPLKSLTTPLELRDFLDSTDKAVLLFEFCGWTPRFLAMNNTTNKNGFDFSTENNQTLVAEEKDNMKGTGDNKLSCSIDYGFSEISWPSQFSSVNDSLIEAENYKHDAGVSCTSDEFQRYELFFQKFIPMSRELFLPPERIRFAVVRERSLLQLLNIEELGSWLIAVSYAACPGCLNILREVDSLRTLLQTEVSSVTELENDLHEHEATLPAKKPTILLFIDRSSNSMQIKRDSQKALNIFRELAQSYEMRNQIPGQANSPGKTSTESNRASWSTLKHSRLQPFPVSEEKLFLQNKMSVMMFKEGQQITLENLVSNLQGSSVHEILNYALQRKEEQKLSMLAKNAGFQLLSKDFDVEVIETLPTHNEIQANQVLGELPGEGGIESSFENKIQAVSYGVQNEETHGHFEADRFLLQHKEDSLDKNSQLDLEPENHHHSMGIATDNPLGWNEEKRLSGMNVNENQKKFRGSFFFFDGQYRLLETLTGRLKMPSVVIIDPIYQKHYVSDEQSVFNISLLAVFINDFLSGKLSPYQQSAPAVRSPRNAPEPPFVNLDFHATDSIPLVTTHTFSELIIGNKFVSKSSGGSWNRNVLVVFTNSWCGFCQRIELVVREVYRAIKGFRDMKMNGSRKEQLSSTGEYIEDIALKLPLVYMMDCTQNDCSLIIESTQQRELYPLLVLFPAEMKTNTVVYGGDIAVSDVIKFLAAHGSPVLLDLIMDKRLDFQDQNTMRQGPRAKNLHHEVILKERFQRIAVKDDHETAQIPLHLQERPHLSAGRFLTATEKLLDVHPFDESRILIVKADQGTGFQGLIMNKQMNWDSFQEVEQGFEFLKQAPLYFGGPVVRKGMPLVALTHGKLLHKEYLEVLQNVYFIDEIGTHKLLEDLRERKENQAVVDYWFFLGYASWGWDQLFDEVAQGAWNVSQASWEQLEWP